MSRRVQTGSILAIAFLVAAAGCPSIPDPFSRGEREDTPSEGDDDDSADAVPQAPRVLVTTIDPTVTISGPLEVGLIVEDPDSSEVTVHVFFGHDSPDAADQRATLVEAAGESFDVVTGDAPMQVQHGITWDTHADVPTVADSVYLLFCPIDAEGLEGECTPYPTGDGIRITNFVIGEATGAFCSPGVIEAIEFHEGRAIVPLGTADCPVVKMSEPAEEDDFAARFELLLVNPLPNDVNFRVALTTRPGDPDLPPGGIRPPGQAQQRPATGPGFADEPAPGRRTAPPMQDAWSGSAAREFGSCPDAAEVVDIGSDARSFSIRQTIVQGSPRTTVGATLMALSANVAIYVDDATPIDFDADCSDPNNAIVPSALPAYGFTNCDLQGVLDLVEQNHWPTLTTFFGGPPDRDCNCRVDVLVTHRLNGLSLTNSVAWDDTEVIRSFAEPEIDHCIGDAFLNPGSNEQEILYVYAPDPTGLWNSTTIAIQDYVAESLNAQLGEGLQRIFTHDIVGAPCPAGTEFDPPICKEDGPPGDDDDAVDDDDSAMDDDDVVEPGDDDDSAGEEGDDDDSADTGLPDPTGEPSRWDDWLIDGMGLLAADLTGYGSEHHQQAWVYLDRSSLMPLTRDNTLEDYADRGNAYLMCRYLYDLYGPDLFAPLMWGGQPSGIASVEFVTGADFEDFVLQWATALMISGREHPDGGQLVNNAVVSNVPDAGTFGVFDPANPQPGEPAGANGYQSGFNVRGYNYTYVGGSDPAGPTEVVEERVFAENIDPYLFHPQNLTFGSIAGDYGTAVIRVAGIEQEQLYLVIDLAPEIDDVLGNAARVLDEDPHDPKLILEDVDGALLTSVRSVPTLSLDGEESTIIGEFDEAEDVDVFQDDGTIVAELVPDTDRYGFTLTETTQVGVWVDRRMTDFAGAVDVADPFIAVALASDVPDALDFASWNFGPATGPCADAALFAYPQHMPAWIAAQANLSIIPEDGGAPLGPVSGPNPPVCALDHDQDGIPDADEYRPVRLVEQIQYRQAFHLDANPAFYAGTFDTLADPLPVDAPFFGADFIDVDSNEAEDPFDVYAASFPRWNIGGRSMAVGEDAVWQGFLPAGDYVIIVGDVDGSVGPYSLAVRRITE